MKIITSFLLKFALAATVLAIIFRYCLSYGIENQTTAIIVLSAVLYAIGMFIVGWHFGKKDRIYLPIHDVGFRFHAATYLIHNSISELWFVFGFNSDYEKIGMIHLQATIWGFFLLCHLLFFLWAKKKSINGLDKTELFE
jgi:hypothetical protein